VSLVKIATVDIPVRVPLASHPGEFLAGFIPIQRKVNPFILLYQGTAPFQEGQGIQDKAIR